MAQLDELRQFLTILVAQFRYVVESRHWQRRAIYLPLRIAGKLNSCRINCLKRLVLTA
jgi:hypothetical protein